MSKVINDTAKKVGTKVSSKTKDTCASLRRKQSGPTTTSEKKDLDSLCAAIEKHLKK